MSHDAQVNVSGIEENATFEKNCSGKDPLISIAIAMWIAVIASVFFLYLYWRHIHLKPSFHVSYRHNAEMQETDLHSGKTTDLRVEKDLDQSKTEQYESLKGCTNRNEDYQSLYTKQQEPSLEKEDSIDAKDL